MSKLSKTLNEMGEWVLEPFDPQKIHVLIIFHDKYCVDNFLGRFFVDNEFNIVFADKDKGLIHMINPQTPNTKFLIEYTHNI